MRLTGFLYSLYVKQRSLPKQFLRSLDWVHKHTYGESGIAVTNVKGEPYPEVSGYFIPTLLDWGERELALQYGRWLVSIQNSDGSWSDPAGTASYTFDTGQILKGLLSLDEIFPDFEQSIRSGCDWILRQVQPTGQVTTPDTQHWRLPNNRIVPEAIHLYALGPLRVAGRKWEVPEYEEAVERAIDYYLKARRGPRCAAPAP